MKFQIERIALFSDAVFAIAITLMIIEVKAPHLPHDVPLNDAIAAVLELVPSFVGIILSFYLIGVFWLRHHQLLRYMSSYNTKMLHLNLTFLLTIIFIPFSTAFVFENLASNSPVPMILYNINYIVATLTAYRLFVYVLNPANNLRAEDVNEDVAALKKEMLFPILVYVLVIILAMITPSFAGLGYGAFALERFFVKKKVGPI